MTTSDVLLRIVMVVLMLLLAFAYHRVSVNLHATRYALVIGLVIAACGRRDAESVSGTRNLSVSHGNGAVAMWNTFDERGCVACH